MHKLISNPFSVVSLLTAVLVSKQQLASFTVLMHRKYFVQGGEYWVEIAGGLLSRCTSSLNVYEAQFHKNNHPAYINSMLAV